MLHRRAIGEIAQNESKIWQCVKEFTNRALFPAGRNRSNDTDTPILNKLIPTAEEALLITRGRVHTMTMDMNAPRKQYWMRMKLMHVPSTRTAVLQINKTNLKAGSQPLIYTIKLRRAKSNKTNGKKHDIDTQTDRMQEVDDDSEADSAESKVLKKKGSSTWGKENIEAAEPR